MLQSLPTGGALASRDAYCSCFVSTCICSIQTGRLWPHTCPTVKNKQHLFLPFFPARWHRGLLPQLRPDGVLVAFPSGGTTKKPKNGGEETKKASTMFRKHFCCGGGSIGKNDQFSLTPPLPNLKATSFWRKRIQRVLNNKVYWTICLTASLLINCTFKCHIQCQHMWLTCLAHREEELHCYDFNDEYYTTNCDQNNKASFSS